LEFANRIRKIREAYGLTQAEVAFKCEISPSAYGQIERMAGNSSVRTLEKIAVAIGVSLPFLIDINCNEYIEKTS
jgi:transcriptional regulator with XRE-family HTH domain